MVYIFIMQSKEISKWIIIVAKCWQISFSTSVKGWLEYPDGSFESNS